MFCVNVFVVHIQDYFLVKVVNGNRNYCSNLVKRGKSFISHRLGWSKIPEPFARYQLKLQDYGPECRMVCLFTVTSLLTMIPNY